MTGPAYVPKINKNIQIRFKVNILMVNGLHLSSAFSTPECITKVSHSPIHSPVGAVAAMQGAAHQIGSNLGFSVLLEDTTTD